MNPILQMLGQKQLPRNNPIMMLVQAMNNGENPMPLLPQMALQHPKLNQAYQVMQGKNPQQWKAMAEKIAREEGIDLNEFIRQLGINNASMR